MERTGAVAGPFLRKEGLQLRPQTVRDPDVPHDARRALRLAACSSSRLAIVNTDSAR